ncbi:MAG: OmpA family protein [Bacteroidota bacterium]
MQAFFTYYKGIFHSQFESPKVLDLKVLRLSDVCLQPRMIFKVEEEITEDEFEKQKTRIQKDLGTQVFSTSPEESEKASARVAMTDEQVMELEFSDGKSSAVYCRELFAEYGKGLVPDEYTAHDFVANKDGISHGRITGRAWVKIPRLTEEEVQERQKLLSVQALQGRQGCISNLLPSGRASGCLYFFRAGCGNIGCGLPLLLLLPLLLFLLWKSCNNNENIQPRVIHDTVYVDEKSKQDVIKKFLDTTTVFKTEAIELPNVQFYTNSAKLLPYSINSVQQLADYLNEHPQVHAVIEGHTDNVGDPANNLRLSQERAETVRQLLISFGVSPDRVQAKGYGKNHPRADNTTVEGRAMNRRVEVRLTNTQRTETKSTELKDGD